MRAEPAHRRCSRPQARAARPERGRGAPVDSPGPPPPNPGGAPVADFRPVLLGTDLGVYSIARSFHEAYGVRSIVVSNQSRGPVDHSRILDNVLVGAGASEDQTVAALVDVARRHAGTPLLLLVN